MSNTNIIKLSSTEDAWKFLKNAALDKNFGNNSCFEFEDWPKISIKFKGKRFQGGQFPATLAKSVDELQKGLYKSYSLLKFGDESSGSLTPEEKDLLEISFSIAEGSLDLSADLKKIFNQISDNVKNMNSRDTLILTAIISTGFCGHSVLNFLENQKKKEHEQQIKLENIKNEQELKIRDKEIINKLIKSDPRYVRVRKINADSNIRLIKNLKHKEETVEFGESNEIYTYDDIKSFSGSKRKYEETEIEIIGTVTKFIYEKNGPFVRFIGPKEKPWSAKWEVNCETKEKLVRDAVLNKNKIKFSISAREAEDGHLKDFIVLDCELLN